MISKDAKIVAVKAITKGVAFLTIPHWNSKKGDTEYYFCFYGEIKGANDIDDALEFLKGKNL